LADFEDMFLSDSEHQLKIKFNPKVTSFKTTVLENKLDTLGGQYPFIFRNGRTSYKEFPISGLISYWMDNEEMFMSCEELHLNAQTEQRHTTDTSTFVDKHTYTINLTSNNFFSEREFKLRVMDWLNNGKPKLFRSAAEGNYIVQLLNVSLSPDEKLGRMLHTFNSQAYEITTNTLEEL
jgi:hypothetical protein